MRIVTRPDFDGIVCAVLLVDALHIHTPIKWVGPDDIQKGRVDILPGDIIANLPYHEKCSVWFDHHVSNRQDFDFKGNFAIEPSAPCEITTKSSPRPIFSPVPWPALRFPI